MDCNIQKLRNAPFILPVLTCKPCYEEHSKLYCFIFTAPLISILSMKPSQSPIKFPQKLYFSWSFLLLHIQLILLMCSVVLFSKSLYSNTGWHHHAFTHSLTQKIIFEKWPHLDLMPTPEGDNSKYGQVLDLNLYGWVEDTNKEHRVTLYKGETIGYRGFQKAYICYICECYRIQFRKDKNINIRNACKTNINSIKNLVIRKNYKTEHLQYLNLVS